MKNNIKVIIFYIVLIALILSATTWMMGQNEPEKVDYYDVLDCFYKEKVESFIVDKNNNVILTLKDNSNVTYKLPDLSIFYSDTHDLVKEQHEAGIISDYDYEQPFELPWWSTFVPYLIVIVFVVLLWLFSMNQAMGGKGGRINSFGRSRAKLMTDKNKVRFEDVAGADEEKAELEEVVAFLKNPLKFSELGARIPRGVLLVGPPGTGKTLLAKAVAGEAGVPFYSISGSDFVEMYVGVGASRVRDLFDTAKKNAPGIIFIDEIDAVGRHRGAGLGGGHDEREQTLNQLLVEMDGFGSTEGVIVIAATNRPDILDPALLRPGRFDRQVTVNYPDLNGRAAILKVHAKNKPFEKTVDLEKVAQATVGFTGADLANLLNEAALHAARKNKRLIGMDDIEEATLKIMVGTQKKSFKIKPEEKRKTAYHEAGHAILAHILPSLDPVRQISIIPSGRALGYTLTVPVEDKFSVYKNGLQEQIVELLGGRVAEKIIFNDISGGASNDIQRATTIARDMVTRYGMSDELGPIVYGSEHSSDEVFLGRDFNNTRNYSEETAFKIDSEIKKIIENAFSKAESLLRENIEKLHATADYLTKYETMDEEQFKFLMDTNPTPSNEEIAAIADRKKKQSMEDNENRRIELEKNAAKKAFTVTSSVYREEPAENEENNTSEDTHGDTSEYDDNSKDSE